MEPAIAIALEIVHAIGPPSRRQVLEVRAAANGAGARGSHVLRLAFVGLVSQMVVLSLCFCPQIACSAVRYLKAKHVNA